MPTTKPTIIKTLMNSDKTKNILPRTRLKAIADEEGNYISDELTAADLNGIPELAEELDELEETVTAHSSRISTLDNTKAAKTALDSTNREVSLLRKAIEGQLMDIEEDHTEAYSKTLPSGTIGVGVNMIGGKSYVKNQLVHDSLFADTSSWRVLKLTLSANDNIATLTYTNDTGYSRGLFKKKSANLPIRVGDKLLFLVEAKGSSNDSYSVDTISLCNQQKIIGQSKTQISTTEFTKVVSIIISDIDGTDAQIGLRLKDVTTAEGEGLTVTIRDFRLVNLTLMFGSGNEPSTTSDPRIASIEAYLAAHPSFVGSEIISADCDEIVSTGKNLFNKDSESIIYNSYLDSNGNVASAAWGLVSEYIKIDPTKNYYISKTFNDDYFRFKCYYDSSKNFISSFQQSRSGMKLVIPSNAMYIRISYQDGTKDSLFLMEYDGINVPEFEPYKSWGLTIPQGLRNTHSLHSAKLKHDEYNFDGKYTKVNVADIDMGSMDYVRDATVGENIIYYKALDGAVLSNNIDFLQTYYTEIFTESLSDFANTAPDKSISKNKGSQTSTSGRILIRDDSCKTVSQLKSALAGHHIYYDLIEPIYYYDPTSPELAVNGGTVIPDATHIVDPESYFPEVIPLLNAEAGGTLTFKQTDTEFPLPNSTDYFVKTSTSVTTE